MNLLLPSLKLSCTQAMGGGCTAGYCYSHYSSIDHNNSQLQLTILALLPWRVPIATSGNLELARISVSHWPIIIASRKNPFQLMYSIGYRVFGYVDFHIWCQFLKFDL